MSHRKKPKSFQVDTCAEGLEQVGKRSGRVVDKFVALWITAKPYLNWSIYI